ncbi:MAG TPA: citrate/2-methylcitrate synthase [Solirubrobacterales bacterium]|nr:citrate/2-methylcitrate synthase [Solirubrobacterales bacterium]
MSKATERLSTEEVARRLGVKRETVYAYVSRGLLERHPASGPHDSRFDPAEVERLAARARRPNRSSALEVVVETELTLLEPAGRLSYRGRDAVELARYRSFEEVVALLWEGAPPTPWRLEGKGAEAVAGLGTVLGPRTPDAERIVAVVATLAARDLARDDRDPESVRRAGTEVFAAILAALRSRAGAGDEGAEPSVAPEDGVAARLWRALAVGDQKPRPDQVAALNAALVLLADHELAASTFTARIAASAWAGPYRVILAGLGPLGGSLHGGAGAAVEAMLDDVAAGADPGAVLDARLAEGPVPGFGHRVYRDRDPRADHLLARLALDRGRPALAIGSQRSTALRRGLRRSTAAEAPWVAAGALLDAAAERRLPAPNVDFALAALAKAHGLRDGSAPTIFTIARIAGIVAHALEEYEHRLRFRPRASYIGPTPPGSPLRAPRRPAR